MRIFLPFIAATLFAISNLAVAAQTVNPAHLVPVPTKIHNSGSETILCQAEIAHWFSMDLVAIPPRSAADLDLRFDPPTGIWAVINAIGEALPVERVWCGLKGRAYETRRMLRLERKRPQPVRLDCRAGISGLVCHSA